MNSKTRHVMAFICLTSVFLLCSFFVSAFSLTPQSENSSLLKYEVNDLFVGSLKHIIQIIDPTASRIMGGEFFVPLIRNETARHYAILNISSSMGQPTILSDDSGNTYAYWSNIIIDGKQNFYAEINYYVLSFSTRYIINPSLIADYNKGSDLYKKYTQPEELIQSNNSKIVSKMQNLMSGANNIGEKVSKIYNFVTTHIRYAKQEEEKGALWALENGVGDCSEYSCLFVALCRAAGIPARVQAGFAFHRVNEALEDGHMWAEYYLENYGWIPVDATWRLFDTLDYRHFSSIQSIPEPTPYANYIFNYTTGPEQIDEKQTVSIKPCSANVFGDGSFAENAVNTVTEIKQAKFALFLAKVFGATLIFSPEATKAEQTLLESQINLQNAIDFWKDLPQIAQLNVADALESAEEAANCAWMLIVKTLILLISISTVIMLIVLVFMKRYKSKLEEKPSEL